MEEPQPYDSQNRIIEPLDYRTLGLSIVDTLPRRILIAPSVCTQTFLIRALKLRRKKQLQILFLSYLFLCAILYGSYVISHFNPDFNL